MTLGARIVIAQRAFVRDLFVYSASDRESESEEERVHDCEAQSDGA